MKIARSWVKDVVEMLLESGAYKSVKYLSDKEVIRATRKRFQGKIRKIGNTEIILTIGKPNYLEREFIKTAKKAKEPFPIKKIQLKFPVK